MLGKNWSAKQYLKFEKERTLPSEDLLSRIHIENPQTIIDIGCGPGNSTALLKKKYPNARVLGVDYSEDMLSRARKDYPDIDFEQCDAGADLSRYRGQFDIVFSNACIQWIPDHKKLIPAMYDMLKAGGILAVQQPMNYEEPIQKIIRSVAANEKWRDRLSLRVIDILTKGEYYDLLSETADEFMLWEVVYYHSLGGFEDIVEWYRGTGMRPYLSQLNEAAGKEYEKDVLDEVKKAYALQKDGTLMFRFPRLFFTATKEIKE